MRRGPDWPGRIAHSFHLIDDSFDDGGAIMADACPQQLALEDGEIRLGLGETPGDLAIVPDYLRIHYWWAYVHPRAVDVFERQWLVNLILWGNYGRLRDAALSELGEALCGTTLQVACAYGDLTVDLDRRVAAGRGALDVVDVLPIQLRNLRKKLPKDTSARLLAMDSRRLRLPDQKYERALVFFLLHEQPRKIREQTLREVFRVVKPGGKIVIVDYAQPRWWNPLRYLWRPLLATLEPFALDLWREDVRMWLPAPHIGHVQSCRFFGGLYQMTIVATSIGARSDDGAGDAQ
jgi:ubiquinone/menaquinone biosynthesis C-methylase UbiE